MKKQVVVIHGGDAFNTYEQYLSSLRDFKIDFERMKRIGWKDSLRQKLGEEFEVVTPFMPNKMNAKYPEWKIWFEKLVPFLEEEIILIGHSLGGIFLVKYLSENKFLKRIKATLLVAACYDDKESEYSLGDFILPESLEGFRKQGGKIFLYQSKDDPVVPFADSEKYRRALPGAQVMIFDNRGHFGQEDFPELVEEIKRLK